MLVLAVFLTATAFPYTILGMYMPDRERMKTRVVSKMEIPAVNGG